MAAGPTEDGQALTFSVAGERLALDAASVNEVLRAPLLRRVPLAPAGLAGVANLRGAVIPIVSLARLLGHGDQESGSGRVVVTGGDSPVGLIVDQVNALVPARRVRSGEDGGRFLPLDTLLAEAFGSLERRGRGVAVGAASDLRSDRAAEQQGFLSFVVAGQEFALPLDSVEEVIALPEGLMTVPRTDDAMLGVTSLRDRLLPLLSLAVLLGLGAAPAGREARVVVARAAGLRLGLVVGSVRAIVRAGEDEIDPVPPVLIRGRQEAQIQGIARLDGGRRLVSILATDHLLEEGLLERLASEQNEESEMKAAASAEVEPFLVFELGDEHFGLPVSCVEEVVRAPERLTRLPKAPDFVEGVINVRGRVIPVIDQRRRFDSSGEASGRGRILVVRIGEADAGFLVDGVSEVVRVPVDQLRPAPELAARGESRVIDRIATLDKDGRMILLVDPQALLDRAEQDMLAGWAGETSAPS